MRVLNDAGIRCRLLRIQKRWPHLRSYAHGMGFRERIRPTAHRVHAANNWLISWSAPRYLGDYGGFYVLSLFFFFRPNERTGYRKVLPTPTRGPRVWPTQTPSRSHAT